MDNGIKKMKEGFSLIELIIAITILAIFVGGSALSVSLLRSADTEGLASGINSSLTDLKALSESRRGPIYLYIYKIEGDGFYAHYGLPNPDGTPNDKPEDFEVPDNHGDDEKLGSDSLTVKLDNGDEIKEKFFAVLQIQKKDGAYIDVTKITTNESGTSTVETVMSTPKYFEVYNGSRLDYKVILSKTTGLHYSEHQ